MELKQLAARFEERLAVDALILYGRDGYGDFAIYVLHRNDIPVNRVIVARGDDPYAQIVRTVVNSNGNKPTIPAIFSERTDPPDLSDRKIDVPDSYNLVSDVLKADKSTDETRYGSKKHRVAEDELTKAGNRLFHYLTMWP